ncbi:hypothetical protein F441_01260 [Phytophthora nicotianae CJ01A1]|uniref:Jacalin-type lectin domain-containing protein n=6 Tax=Phytophthora nicotianae TaxID=4792 RepID=W2RHN9_PHYN3|nr:hypothetical protein PPTG_01095 [Phytophthora nicotianae INRA-310]ETI56110.1 hypothetical protein F443_01283 [Phytophthora nicotianae P1569]ETK95922.1 hypothetical protein L915_01210 [Phytophthora nicotianae]ETO84861.1 hypothetical protein F444_01282 [Phytophthora nicotianae P1976]ETP25919.1 hypothetical protein F441_01260 [Phytophthora nicotianae CJ01A1]ETP53924.1 hypothetical protein F442_01224 [Phytophthora nicotianae P10297]KUF91118.1 hypothetical protein AM587_10015216 [Phytophthora n
MKLILQVLTTLAFAAGVAAALQDGVQLGVTRGGPHGDAYSDLEIVSPGQTVHSITIRSSDRVDAVGLNVTSPSGQNTILYHGGDGGDKDTRWLAKGEHIVGVEAHWDKYYRKTRLVYIKFTTDKGNEIYGGTKTDDLNKKASETAPKGFQLGGFVGYSGKELDSMGPIWTSIKPVKKS